MRQGATMEPQAHKVSLLHRVADRKHPVRTAAGAVDWGLPQAALASALLRAGFQFHGSS